MRRFVLPDTCDPALAYQSIRIEGREVRYLCRVLRLGEGDTFPGIDAQGREYGCTILEAGRDRVLLGLKTEPGSGKKVPGTVPCSPRQATSGDVASFDVASGDAVAGRDTASLSGHRSGAQVSGMTGSPGQTGEGPAIVLIQGLPKAGKMDLIVRQATELGVAAIIPLLSRHCVARPHKGDESGNRRERWMKIVKEAMQQSGSPIATEILPVSTPEDLATLIPEILQTRGDREWLGLLLHESRLDTPSLHQYCAGNPATIVLCIGPEGGFAREEVGLLESTGFRIAHLRVPVLRTETAAICAVAAVKTITTERDTWNPA